MDWSFNSAASFQGYLLACFVLGVLLSAKCLVQMAFPRCPTPKLVEVIIGLAAFALAFILGIDALGNGVVLSALPPPLLTVIVVGLGLTFVGVQLGVARVHAFRRQLALQPLAWAAVGLSLTATTWSSQRYNSGNLKIEMDRVACIDGELVTVYRCAGVTDRGREVELFRWTQEGQSELVTNAFDQPSSENERANCHGWVFTRGQHLLKGDGVERILEDNGYELCQTPQPGDLIIYRDVNGAISHTGLVTAAFMWGAPVIESKWGLAPRFVHSPDEQPYGQRYSYYHSARKGHSLAILPTGPAKSLASRGSKTTAG